MFFLEAIWKKLPIGVIYLQAFTGIVNIQPVGRIPGEEKRLKDKKEILGIDVRLFSLIVPRLILSKEKGEDFPAMLGGMFFSMDSCDFWPVLFKLSWHGETREPENSSSCQEVGGESSPEVEKKFPFRAYLGRLELEKPVIKTDGISRRMVIKEIKKYY